MADGSSVFGGGGSAAAGDVFGGAGFESDPVLTGASDVVAEEAFSYDGPGFDYGSLAKALIPIIGSMSSGQSQQQPAYTSFVPPQSMMMQPRAMPSGMPRGQTQIQTPQNPSVMSQAAASKLQQESSSGLGGALGTLAGAGIGFLAGGPAGATIGASAGGKLGSSI